MRQRGSHIRFDSEYSVTVSFFPGNKGGMLSSVKRTPSATHAIVRYSSADGATKLCLLASEAPRMS